MVGAVVAPGRMVDRSGGLCLKQTLNKPIQTIFLKAFLRRSANADGFTVIELLVVLMTMTLLIAIAIPTLMGFRDSAQNQAAEAALTTAEKVAFLVFVENGSLPKKNELLALLPTREPTLTWIDHKDSSTSPRQISIDVDAQELTMAALSTSGSCYWARVSFGAASARGFVEAAAKCEGHDFKNTADTGW